MDESLTPSGGLVITRRLGEAFHLQHPDGSTIVVTLLSSKGSQTKVHINAPKKINIVREELLARTNAKVANT